MTSFIALPKIFGNLRMIYYLKTVSLLQIYLALTKLGTDYELNLLGLYLITFINYFSLAK